MAYDQLSAELLYTCGVLERIRRIVNSHTIAELIQSQPSCFEQADIPTLNVTLSNICASLQDVHQMPLELGSRGLLYSSCWVRRSAYDIEDSLDAVATNHLKQKRLYKPPLKNPFELSFQLRCFHYETEVLLAHLGAFDLRAAVEFEKKGLPVPPSPSFLHTNTSEDTIVGSASGKEEMINFIFRPSNQRHPNIVFVCGDSGIGKTTLVKAVCNDVRVSTEFGLILWASDTRIGSYIDLGRIIVAIIQSATSQCQFYPENLDMKSVKGRLRDILRGQKYLLVLDDFEVAQPSWWEELRQLLEVGSTGSTVILMSTCMEQMPAGLKSFRLKGLPEHESWSLFTKCAAFDAEAKRRYPYLEQLGRSIVQICNGNPLAVKIFGRALHSNRDERSWAQVIKREKRYPNPRDHVVNFAVRIGFENLPCYLMPLFCAILPDKITSRDQLVYLWMAQGLLPSASSEENEELGDMYCDELLLRGFLQTYHNHHHTFQMHSKVQEFARIVLQEETKYVPDEFPLSVMGRNVQWKGSDEEFDWDILSEIKARSFYFKHYVGPVTKSFLEGLISALKRVRVLFLDHSEFEELPESIGELVRLRYLSLAGNHRLQVIPTSIRELVNLQTLDLSGCQQLKKLPQLTHGLRHLLFSVNLTSLPAQALDSWTPLRLLKICNCQNLKSLPEETVAELTALKVLRIHDCPSVASLPNTTKYLSKLEELSILNCQALDLTEWDGLDGLTSLRLLQFQGIPQLANFPEGLESAAGSLRILVVRNCINLKNLPTCLFKCNNLLELLIDGCPNMVTLPTGIQAVKALRVLKISNCPELAARFDRESGQDWHLISHIPKIQLHHPLIQNLHAMDSASSSEIGASDEVEQGLRNLRVADFTTPDGSWNWEMFSMYLPAMILMKFSATGVRLSQGLPDSLTWAFSASGEYTVGSAYEAICGTRSGSSTNLPSSRLFDIIWKLQVSERIRHFLWLGIKGKMLTNVERVRRHITTDPVCGICRDGEETLIHVFRDCAKAKQVWHLFLSAPGSRTSSPFFFQEEADVWVYKGLTGGYVFYADRKPDILFATIIWWLWKWRNMSIFRDVQVVVDRLPFLLRQAREFEEVGAGRPAMPSNCLRHERLVAWCRPAQGVFKVNTDGAKRDPFGLTIAGGVVRDSSGTWIGGFVKNIGICSVPMAELWGIYHGLHIAWEKGCRQVIVEPDSALAIGLIGKGGGCVSLSHEGLDKQEVDIEEVHDHNINLSSPDLLQSSRVEMVRDGDRDAGLTLSPPPPPPPPPPSFHQDSGLPSTRKIRRNRGFNSQGAEYNSKLDQLPDLVVPSNDIESFSKGILFLLGEGCEFEKEKLVQLWMALGFIKDEINGPTYFETLVSEGYILLSDSNTLYKVNAERVNSDLDIIRDKSKYLILESTNQHNVEPEEILHVSVVCDEVNDAIFKMLGKFNKLVTLLFHGTCGPRLEHLSLDLFLSFMSLLVLDLSGTDIKELPSSIGKMVHLRYLDLSWTLIELLPESVSCLQRLQTLRLKGCSRIRRLPRDMKMLTELRHLDFNILGQLTVMPKGLSALIKLRTLSSFLVGTQEGFDIRELGDLNNLTGEFCIARLENVKSADDAKSASITSKSCLTKLELRWSDYPLRDLKNEVVDETVLENLRPPSDLEELRIRCYAGTNLPSWIADESFHRLARITLFKCEHVSMLPSLQTLPSVEYLELISLNSVIQVDVRGEIGHVAFPKLQTLVIDEMLNLKTWTEARECDFPCLVELTIKGCPNLSDLPSLLYLSSMKRLEMSYCPQVQFLPDKKLSTSLEFLIVYDCPLIKESCWEQGGRQWELIKHVPNVWIDQEEIIGGVDHDSDMVGAYDHYGIETDDDDDDSELLLTEDENDCFK